MRKVFVTGKSGFIGSHLVASLKKNEYTILEDANKCKVWILMAGRMDSSDIQDNIDNNFLLNIDLIKTVKTLPLKIIYISSIDVYKLNTYYGAAKLAAETFLKIFCNQNNIKLVILRPSQIYGPGDKGKKIIPKFIEKIKNNEVIELYNKGFAKRNYLYVSDLVDVIVKSIKMDVEGVFDVVGSKAIMIKNVIKTLETEMNKKAKLKLITEPKIDFRKGIKITLGKNA